MGSLPDFGSLMMTLRAGKLTPAAKVVVQNRNKIVLDLKADSMTLRSSRVRPPWWYIMPALTPESNQDGYMDPTPAAATRSSINCERLDAVGLDAAGDTHDKTSSTLEGK